MLPVPGPPAPRQNSHFKETRENCSFAGNPAESFQRDYMEMTSALRGYYPSTLYKEKKTKQACLQGHPEPEPESRTAITSETSTLSKSFLLREFLFPLARHKTCQILNPIFKGWKKQIKNT